MISELCNGMGRNKFQKSFLTRLLDSVPGKQTFGVYRFFI